MRGCKFYRSCGAKQRSSSIRASTLAGEHKCPPHCCNLRDTADATSIEAKSTNRAPRAIFMVDVLCVRGVKRALVVRRWGSFVWAG